MRRDMLKESKPNLGELLGGLWLEAFGLELLCGCQYLIHKPGTVGRGRAAGATTYLDVEIVIDFEGSFE